MLFVRRPSATDASVGPGWVHTALLLTLLFSRVLCYLLVSFILTNATTDYGDRLHWSSVLGNCEKRWTNTKRDTREVRPAKRWQCGGGVAAKHRGGAETSRSASRHWPKPEASSLTLTWQVGKAGPRTKEGGIDTIKPSIIHVGLPVVFYLR
jgi:hypothetical protein